MIDLLFILKVALMISALVMAIYVIIILAKCVSILKQVQVLLSRLDTLSDIRGLFGFINKWRGKSSKS